MEAESQDFFMLRQWQPGKGGFDIGVATNAPSMKCRTNTQN
jgi:hypothetical protein